MVEKYLSKYLLADGYERWICLEHLITKSSVCAHYIDKNFEEFNRGIISDCNRVIEGELSIDLVSNYELVDNIASGFEQPIFQSSHIVAFGKIINVLDEYTLICEVKGLLDEIKVEFEVKVDMKVGNIIKIVGSLEIEME